MQNQNALTTCHSDVPFLFLYTDHSCILHFCKKCILHFIKKCITPEFYFGFLLTLNFCLKLAIFRYFAWFLKIETSNALYWYKGQPICSFAMEKNYWSVSSRIFCLWSLPVSKPPQFLPFTPYGVSVFRSWFDVALISIVSALVAALEEGLFI